MNPVIKRELEKVRVPLPAYDDTTTLITILRESVNKEVKMFTVVQNHYYLIQLADYILNEPPNFSLSANWNKGIKPVSQFLKVEVNKIMGKMIQVSGYGFDWETQSDKSDNYLGLWLPLASIGVVQEL